MLSTIRAIRHFLTGRQFRRLLIFAISANVAILVHQQFAIAADESVSLEPTRIIYQVAEKNLAALLLGVLVGIYLVSSKFKIFERLDDLEKNQKKMISYIVTVGNRIDAMFPISKIPGDGNVDDF